MTDHAWSWLNDVYDKAEQFATEDPAVDWPSEKYTNAVGAIQAALVEAHERLAEYESIASRDAYQRVGECTIVRLGEIIGMPAAIETLRIIIVDDQEQQGFVGQTLGPTPSLIAIDANDLTFRAAQTGKPRIRLYGSSHGRVEDATDDSQASFLRGIVWAGDALREGR